MAGLTCTLATGQLFWIFRIELGPTASNDRRSIDSTRGARSSERLNIKSCLHHLAEVMVEADMNLLDFWGTLRWHVD